ncbi:MAG TPA: M28 family peptidase [Chthonomonadaceae bacterium]|nr:M28 family peptidase [Chthonomonadaceae bacterium]
MLKASRSPGRSATSLLVLALCGLGACNSVSGTPATPAAASGGTAGTTIPVAASTVKLQDNDHEPFNGQRAMAILKKQCDFGVRPLGSDAHEKTKEYLISQMKLYADEVKLQQFKYRGMTVTNIVGVFYPEGSDRPAARPVVLMTHWDTRPIADGPYSSEIAKGVQFRYGPTGWHPQAPIMGANDGASGPGVLLELARLFKAKHPPVGVLMLLDDGEDYGDFRGNSGAGDGVELGARYFAKNYRSEKSFGQPAYGILLDMVGAKNGYFTPEKLSEESAPTINSRVFDIGRSLGYDNVFRRGPQQDVGDDHVSMNAAFIPTIDLIHPLPSVDGPDDAYRYWHTLQDTPDKCSPEMLKAVGDTIAATIYRETPSK